jgi:hypothetical protein
LISGGYKQRLKIPYEMVNDVLDGALRAVHDRLDDLTNKHVAHRVGDAEQARVLLVLSNPVVGRSVDGVINLTLRFAMPDSDFLAGAALAAQQLRDAVRRELDELGQAIVEEMAGRDIDELYANSTPMA